jgi:hypothetical protein
VKTVSDVIALAKAKPGILDFGSAQTSSLFFSRDLIHPG